MFPDALSLIAYTVLFIAVMLLTMRRPAYGVCALIVTAPLAFYQITGPTMMTLGKCTIAAIALGLYARSGSYAQLRSPVARSFVLAALAVVAATLLSIVVARYPDSVIRETLKALEYAVVFILAFAAYRSDPDSKLIGATVVVMTFAVCAASLAQEFIGAPSVLLMNGHPTPRIAGPLEGPNQLAGYLDISLALLFAFAVQSRRRMLFAALFVAALTDVLTFSRGGMAGGVAAVIATAFAGGRSRRAIAATAAGALSGAIVAAGWGFLAHTFGLARFWDLSASAYAGGVGTRPQLWRAALALWRAHPLLGVGAGNFEIEASSTHLTNAHTHANSLYLQSLVEGGIPLLLANAWVLVLSFMTFARNAARSPLVAGAFGASVGLAVHQTVDLLIFYPKVGTWWWIVLALGAASLGVRRVTEPAA